MIYFLIIWRNLSNSQFKIVKKNSPIDIKLRKNKLISIVWFNLYGLPKWTVITFDIKIFKCISTIWSNTYTT